MSGDTPDRQLDSRQSPGAQGDLRASGTWTWLILTGAVLLVVFFSYVSILNTPLVSDDYYQLSDAVTRNPWRYFWTSIFPKELGADFVRPVSMFTFALDHCISGVEPLVPRTTNLLLHLATTAMVGMMVAMLPSTAGRTRAGLVPPMAAMLLFGLHPQAPGAVCWVSARFDLLCAFFGVAGTLAWLKSASKSPLSAWRLVAILAFALSLLSKETGVAFLAAAGAVELWHWRTAPAASARKAAGIALCQLMVLVAAYLAYHFWVLGGIGGYKSRVPVNPYAPLGVMLAVLWPFAHPGPVPWPSMCVVSAAAALIVLLVASATRAAGNAPGRPLWLLALVLWLLPAALCVLRQPVLAILMHTEARLSDVPAIGLAAGAGWLLDRWSPRNAEGAVVTCLAVLLGACIWVQQGEVNRWDRAGRMAGAILDQTLALVPPYPKAIMLFRVPSRLSLDEPYGVFGIGLSEALATRYGRSDLRVDLYPKPAVFDYPPPGAYVLRYDWKQQAMVLTHAPQDATVAGTRPGTQLGH